MVSIAAAMRRGAGIIKIMKRSRPAAHFCATFLRLLSFSLRTIYRAPGARLLTHSCLYHRQNAS